jgi:Lon protease-like protein
VAETIPLFPLAAVLLPGTSLPLHIFEPRYRQLIMDLVTDALPGRHFGVVAKKPGWTVDIDHVDQVCDVGCSAVLREVKRLPDGRFDIVTKGDQRFRLLAIDSTSAPYLLGVVEWLPDSTPAGPLAALMPALAAAARAAHRRYCRAAWQNDDWTEPPNDTDPAELAHLVAADCLLAEEDRQRLLEETCPAKRLRLARRLLHLETEILGNLHAVPMQLSELEQQANLN